MNGYYVKGSDKSPEEVINLLISKGANNALNWAGNNPNSMYFFIDGKENNSICLTEEDSTLGALVKECCTELIVTYKPEPKHFCAEGFNTGDICIFYNPMCRTIVNNYAYSKYNSDGDVVHVAFGGRAFKHMVHFKGNEHTLNTTASADNDGKADVEFE